MLYQEEHTTFGFGVGFPNCGRPKTRVWSKELHLIGRSSSVFSDVTIKSTNIYSENPCKGLVPPELVILWKCFTIFSLVHTLMQRKIIWKMKLLLLLLCRGERNYLLEQLFIANNRSDWNHMFRIGKFHMCGCAHKLQVSWFKLLINVYFFWGYKPSSLIPQGDALVQEVFFGWNNVCFVEGFLLHSQRWRHRPPSFLP